jgi:hypothetical protein
VVLGTGGEVGYVNPETFDRQKLAIPQFVPQVALSCMTSACLGSPRGRCKLFKYRARVDGHGRGRRHAHSVASPKISQGIMQNAE